MKHRKARKPSFPENIGYEASDDAHSTPVPADDFDYASVYAADEKIDADAAAHGLSRDEAKAQLNARGHSEPEQELVLGRVAGSTVKELEAATGWKRSRIYQKLKSATIKKAIADLRSGGFQTQPSELASEPKHPEAEPKEIQIIPLTVAMNALRNSVKSFPSYVAADLGYQALALAQLNLPDSMNLAEKMLVAAFRYWPPFLSNPQVGPGLIAVLEKLLEDALYGSKSAAAKARKTLNLLLRFGRGAPRGYPSVLLKSGGLFKICVSLHSLWEVWDATLGKPIHERLQIIRPGIGSEEKDFSDQELQPLMSGDLLTAATRVAEKATGISAEVFLRAAREDMEFQKWLQELPPIQGR